GNAVDKVPPASCTPLTADQRGYPRPSANSANCDEGAYELTTCDGTPLNTPGAFAGCPSSPPPSGGGGTTMPAPAPPVPFQPKVCPIKPKGAVAAGHKRHKKKCGHKK